MYSVVIRTNGEGTSLTVDDSSTGSVYHYGMPGALNIIKCHTSSYHESGVVGFAEIAKGRIVLEGNSTLNTTIHSTNNNITIENTAISASQTTGNTQCLIAFNPQCSKNIVNLVDCTLQLDGTELTGLYYDAGTENYLYVDERLTNTPIFQSELFDTSEECQSAIENLSEEYKYVQAYISNGKYHFTYVEV